MAKVLVLYYSNYGHIAQMAEAIAEGARSAGGVSAMDDWTAITVTGLDQACSSKLNNNPAFQDSGMAGEMPAPK